MQNGIYPVYSGGKWYKVYIEKIIETDRIIRYKVSGRNKYLILENNLPVFKNRGLKHRKPAWKLVEGNVYTSGFVTHLINFLDRLQNGQKK